MGFILDLIEGIMDAVCGTPSTPEIVENLPNVNMTNEKIEFLNTTAIYTGDGADINGKIKPHGTGTAVLDNGDSFIGKFNKGKAVDGVYRFENGSYCNVEYDYNSNPKYSKPYGYRQPREYKRKIWWTKEYVGELKNDVPDGIGEMEFSRFLFAKDVYKGGFKNGEKHGVGKYTFDNGDYDVCVYINGTEIAKLEEYKKEEEKSQSNYDNDYDDDEVSDYNGTGSRESAISYIESCIRRGDYEEAKREIGKFDSGADVQIFVNGSFSTKTASDWEDTFTDWANDENENGY